MSVVTLLPDRGPSPTSEPSPGPAPLRRGRAPDLSTRELVDGEVDVLTAVFDGLSERSRYLRFHCGTPRLSSPMRRCLTAVDGQRHIAVAAFADGRPIGIARLVAQDGQRAELALEVVDAWHSCGVGRRLLEAVAVRGRMAGYTEVVAELLTENRAMRAVLASVLPVVSSRLDGPKTTVTAALRVAAPVALAA